MQHKRAFSIRFQSSTSAEYAFKSSYANKKPSNQFAYLFEISTSYYGNFSMDANKNTANLLSSLIYSYKRHATDNNTVE